MLLYHRLDAGRKGGSNPLFFSPQTCFSYLNAENAVVVELPPLVLHSGVRAVELGWGSDCVVVDVVAQVCVCWCGESMDT